MVDSQDSVVDELAGDDGVESDDAAPPAAGLQPVGKGTCEIVIQVNPAANEVNWAMTKDGKEVDDFDPLFVLQVLSGVQQQAIGAAQGQRNALFGAFQAQVQAQMQNQPQVVLASAADMPNLTRSPGPLTTPMTPHKRRG